MFFSKWNEENIPIVQVILNLGGDWLFVAIPYMHKIKVWTYLKNSQTSNNSWKISVILVNSGKDGIQNKYNSAVFM
jgi:hypothetical protein